MTADKCLEKAQGTNQLIKMGVLYLTEDYFVTNLYVCVCFLSKEIIYNANGWLSSRFPAKLYTLD